MRKLLISALCLLAAAQFSFAQSNAERNKAIYRELNQAANEGKLTDYAKYYAESHENLSFDKGRSSC